MHPDDARALAPDDDSAACCFDVSEREIDAFLVKSNSIAALQASLKCGTNCGSCLPELRRKVDGARMKCAENRGQTTVSKTLL